MHGGWTARCALARAAAAGLALGLAALGTLALWGTAVTHATAGRVRAVNDVSAVWNDIFDHVTVEDAALRAYLATGGTDLRRQPLVVAVNSASDQFGWLLEHGGPAEAEHARSVRIDYDNYTKVIRTVLDLTDRTQLSGYAEPATRYFAALRDRIVGNVDRKQRELAEFLAEADERNVVLRWIVLAVISVDALFCVASSAVLIAYQRRAERELATNRHGAFHDTLTGLPNRRMLAEHAERAVTAVRGGQGMAGLLLIDLDRFKDINDTLGHHYGDRLLRQVAGRLSKISRQSDVVARLGGDEFAVLLPRVESAEDLLAVAERVRRTIQEPVVLDGLTVGFGASIGASSCPLDAADADELLQHADIAMYIAKRGGFGLRLYDPGKDGSDAASLSVLSDLRRGIEHGELVLYYQPKIDAVSLRPIGVEALVRWQHPDRGLLPPGAFLPAIESTELIDRLTEVVLQLAVRQAGVWQLQGRRLPVAVNITARSLLDARFPEKVMHLLDQCGVAPEMLTLELTESALITVPALASEVLRQLRRYGVQSSIDDFGTGYSSMAFLRDMPVHELKIDRSFVTTMRTDERNHAIVRAMVDLARNLTMNVVAEGVEDRETLDALAGLGCGFIQGYYVSRPLGVAELHAWLDRQSDFASVA